MTTTEQLKLLLPYDCEAIYIDNHDLSCDKELFVLLETLKSGDMLIAISLSSFGKQYKSMAKLLEQLEEKKVSLITVLEKIDSRKLPYFYSISKSILDTSLCCHKEKTRQSLTRLKDEGALLGRPKIDEDTIRKMQFLSNQKYTLREIAEMCQVSLGSVHKYTTHFFKG
ncbi:recombinase family protein [Vagococcus sp. BWB3-3]|uniref:Recombinase family protein n=1 Tax=Vagococcus allomyrinae TaxID=2794353 RepID=A0A940P8M9_9ENTE|nr:recombinase family protein [Vagococcus allomyrinae]MBP1040120.1 recombinase family protein [Vagococcus allomyrinae]